MQEFPGERLEGLTKFVNWWELLISGVHDKSDSSVQKRLVI